jgi:hypothetical protein
MVAAVAGEPIRDARAMTADEWRQARAELRRFGKVRTAEPRPAMVMTADELRAARDAIRRGDHQKAVALGAAAVIADRERRRRLTGE